MNKKLKILLLGVLLANVVGCASMDTVVKSRLDNSYKLSKTADGVLYGVYGSTDSRKDIDDVCNAIKDADPRCLERDKYNMANVFHAFGFSAAAANTVALVPKELNIKTTCTRTGSSDCTYVSVKVEPGKFGTVLGVASLPGDGKCTWSGMPRAGGTVCKAYNWDYRTNMNDWSTTNGVMSVRESK